jgi:hypothetical protein
MTAPYLKLPGWLVSTGMMRPEAAGLQQGIVNLEEVRMRD